MMLELRFLWKSTSQNRWGQNFLYQKTWSQYDANMWTCFAKQNKTNLQSKNTSYFKNTWILQSKLRLLTIHHSILGENWSTETINYFGLKVFYQQAHLILHTNVKNMMVSTLCYCCHFLIASFCCIFDMIYA